MGAVSLVNEVASGSPILSKYGCELSPQYLWRWVSLFGRLDIILLALLLAYIAAVVLRTSCLYRLARSGRENNTGILRTLAAELNLQVNSLNSIASVAPYLGLVGTCAGLLGVFGGFGMEKHAVLIMIASKTAAALVTTFAGILVATLATFSYNYLRTRIDLLDGEVYNHAQRIVSPRLLSQLPPFGLLAATGLALLVAAYLPFSSFHTPKGLYVEVAPDHCEYDGDDRLIVLHITDAGQLFVNNEREDWSGLADRIGEIYGKRMHRTLYVLADDTVPFQTVANAIDIVEHDPALNVRVRLITPRASNAHCPQPIATVSSRHASR